MPTQAMQSARGAAQSLNPSRRFDGGLVETITTHPAYQAGQMLGDAAIDRGFDAITPDTSENVEFEVVDEKGNVVEKTTTQTFEEEGLATANIMGAVRLIGGALIGIAVLVVVLAEVFSLSQIQNASGPFSGIIDSLETTGVAAISLLVIGLLVLAANRVMGFFGSGGM